MTPLEHNKTLSTLHLIYAGIHGLTLAALVLMIFVGLAASPIASSIPAFWVTLGVVALIVVLVSVVVLPLAAAYGLRKRRKWAKPVTIVTSIVSLINIPIGTALGIYAIKFFRSAAGSTLYGGSVATSEAELQGALVKNRQLSSLADRLN